MTDLIIPVAGGRIRLGIDPGNSYNEYLIESSTNGADGVTVWLNAGQARLVIDHLNKMLDYSAEITRKALLGEE